MKVELRINAQYFENYNVTGEGEPSFRPKGGQVFTCAIDPELLLHVGNEGLINACEEVLKAHSNGAIQFTYRSHEVLFSDPIAFEARELTEAIMKQFD
jgi:hypothetical protein